MKNFNDLYFSNYLIINTIVLIFILGFLFLIKLSVIIQITFSVIIFILILTQFGFLYLKKNENKNKLNYSFNESFESLKNNNEYTFNNNNFNNRSNYDNLILKPEKSCWRKNPSNLPLINANSLYIPQGTPINLNKKSNFSYILNNDALPVDGIDETRKSLFTFAFNQCRPECCPSTYSCDKGCICTTEQQRKFINQRGIVNYPKNTERIF